MADVTATEIVRGNLGSLKVVTGKFTEVDTAMEIDTGVRHLIWFVVRQVDGGDVSGQFFFNSKTASDVENDRGWVHIPDDELAAGGEYAFEAVGGRVLRDPETTTNGIIARNPLCRGLREVYYQVTVSGTDGSFDSGLNDLHAVYPCVKGTATITADLNITAYKNFSDAGSAAAPGTVFFDGATDGNRHVFRCVGK